MKFKEMLRFANHPGYNGLSRVICSSRHYSYLCNIKSYCMQSSIKIFRFFPIIVFLNFSLWLSPAFSQTIRINEVMASNRDVISDEDGSFEDWIEILNYGDEPVNLEGIGITDDYMEPFKWVMPEYSLQPDEYLLIWASGKDRKPLPHTLQQGIRRLFYPDITGSSVDDLVNHNSFPGNPASTSIVNNYFEAPTDIADNYGQHMYTWITAPATGNYIFWIASDDNSKLYLSTDGSPENVQLIAQVPGWTSSRQWNKYPQQQSGQVTLQEGQQYYLSALMKEAQGGDNLALRWQLPDNAIEEPLSAEHCFLPSDRWHTNFSISADGEELILTAPGGEILDSMPPVPIPANISYGRLPDDDNAWFYFEDTTPEAENASTGFNGITESPAVSPTSGVFTEPVTVQIITTETDANIYYTTDGSLPSSNNGYLYTGSFTISGTAWIRAVASKPGKINSEPVSSSISVADEDISMFSSNIPVMIIKEHGTPITPGERTPAFMSVIEPGNEARVNLTDLPAMDGKIIINIRGSSSQGFPKKGYGFHILEEDENNRKVSLLGMPEEHNWVLHGPFSDKTLMRNAYSYSLGSDIGHYSPRTRFIELFMHKGTGPVKQEHYHGVYVLTERIKIAPGRVEIEELEPYHNSYPEVTGGYIFKKDRLGPGETGLFTERESHFAFDSPGEFEITPAQWSYLKNYLDSLESVLFSNDFNDPQTGYSNFIDARSFIDMHLITELTKEIDGYRLSTFFYKDRNGKVHLGPLWDFNLSLGNANYLEGWNPQGWYYPLISENQYMHGWFNRLFLDESFSDQYNRRYRSLRQTAFSNGNMLGKVMEYYNLLNEAQERNYERWDILGTWIWPNYYIGQTWNDEVFWMMDWIEARLAWMDTQLGEPYTMLHYWNFNDITNFSDPAYTVNEAQTEFNEAPESEVTTDSGQEFSGINSRNGDKPQSHLRVNNPLGTELIFRLPSTGYKDLLFSYESRRSGSGANRQYISWSVDGDEFLPFDTINITESPLLYQFDFINIDQANNNPAFSIKISFDQVEDGTGGYVGNNRFDNVTLDGEALPGTNRPPVQTQWFQDIIKLVENGDVKTMNLNHFFKDPDGDNLQITLEAEQSDLVSLFLNYSLLTINPNMRGGTQVNVTVSDGINPSLQSTFYTLVYPEATDLSANPNFSFNFWSPDEPEGSFPENMLFLQSRQSDPVPATAISYAYHIPAGDYSQDDQGNIGFPYRNTRRTRINGLGENGISFINTGRDRDLGAALVALNTQDSQELYLSWTSSTIIANSKKYAMRLQYRTDYGMGWRDWKDADGNLIEYAGSEINGHSQEFLNIPFPEDLLNREYLQIRWLYYFTGQQNNQEDNSRDMLAINDITIGEYNTGVNDPEGEYKLPQLKVFPNPTGEGMIFFNREVTGLLFDITGRPIKTITDKSSVFTADLSNGVYIFRTDQGKSIRFIVNNP